jgi:hypothetical protein
MGWQMSDTADKAWDDKKAEFDATVPAGRYINDNDGRWSAALREWERRRSINGDERRADDFELFREMVNAGIELEGEFRAAGYRATIRKFVRQRDQAELQLAAAQQELVRLRSEIRRSREAVRKAARIAVRGRLRGLVH